MDEKPADSHYPDPSPASSGRRRFLRNLGALGTSVTAGVLAGSAAELVAAEDKATVAADHGAAIPQRALGKTGIKVSVIGLGGHHLGDTKSVEVATQIMDEALAAGINFVDTCWEYQNGQSENWIGRALQGRREKVFLMTKVCTHGRTAKLAMEMLEQSLRRLGTDHLDLWQIHGVGFDNDPDQAYAKGGVLEALELAKKQGKTRLVGFTGHKEAEVHLRMITMGYPFDTVQMPLNPFDANFRSFEKLVLPEANRRGMAVLGMKSMCGTAWAIKQGLVTAQELLRYAMSLPVALTISGMESLDILRQNLAVARGFQPMSEAEMDALRKRCAETAADGRFEPYKVSLKYDNPWARIPHGFPIDGEQKEVKQYLKDGRGTWTTQ